MFPHGVQDIAFGQDADGVTVIDNDHRGNLSFQHLRRSLTQGAFRVDVVAMASDQINDFGRSHPLILGPQRARALIAVNIVHDRFGGGVEALFPVCIAFNHLVQGVGALVGSVGKLRTA